MDHTFPWLKYLAADDCADEKVEFEGMDVESVSGEHLGDVEGFVVDADSGRPYYVVVDSGGWFKSKHFLLPVGHARLNWEREVLVADLNREQVDAFPGFDMDKFDALTPAELERLNDDTCSACGTSDAASSSNTTQEFPAGWDRPDYRYPDWWRTNSESNRPARSIDATDEK
jgi:hypothetical protein